MSEASSSSYTLRRDAAARQLASRARRRVQGATTATATVTATAPGSNLTSHREIVAAFLAAARAGNFDSLLTLLDPQVVLRTDPEAVKVGAANEILGARDVAETFSGRARLAQPVLVLGAAGAVWAPDGKPRIVFGFSIVQGDIVAIEILADPLLLEQIDLSVV